MSDLNWEDEEEERIPYDSEPIVRRTGTPRTNRQRSNNENRNVGKSSALWKVVTALMLVVVLFMGFTLFKIGKQIEELKDERANYISNINSEGGDLSYAGAKGMLSTVSVSASSTDNGNTAESFFSSSMASRGSGVILEVNKETGDAYILTNYHVVCSTSSLKKFNYHWIMLWDSITPIKATYVGGSFNYDIAVLKIEGSSEIKNSACTSVSVAKSTQIAKGEQVIAIGNSMARNLGITTGVVSVEEELMGSSSYSMYIRHSADVNSGNSGGGLFNSSGELIGIVNAKFMDVNASTGELIYDEIIHGMNYAIPSEIAISIGKNIIRNNGVLLKPSLGLSLGNTVSYEKQIYEIREADGKGYTTYELVVSKATHGFSVGDKLETMKYTFGGKEIVVELNRLFSLESNIFNLDKNSKVVIVADGVEEEIIITNTTQVV